MRSATSFFDKTLFRSQLKHTWPLWLGYTALWLFLVPVALFSALSAYQGSYSAADASGFCSMPACAAASSFPSSLAFSLRCSPSRT